VAGFIGSHLAERLVEGGCEVVGVDCFTDYYARGTKEKNLADLRRSRNFTLVEQDLANGDLSPLLHGIDFVFHEAGQAGVRASWDDFGIYTENNIVATQRLLEAARTTLLRGFVFASSSSVYGGVTQLPTPETALPRPVSPYGVTKLAAEHLCLVYGRNFKIPVVSLRYFSVYGPRQRPDMAFHKLIRALLAGEEFEVFGDGEQTRDFTYVADVVRANLLAARLAAQGEIGVFNIGGGSRVTLNQVVGQLEEITGQHARRVRRPAQAGDARHTYADCTAARQALRFKPEWTLEAGLASQVKSLQEAMVAV
jgi:UDP-glucose 4-epimerase